MNENPFAMRRVRFSEQDRFLIALVVAAAIVVALLVAALPGAAS